MHLISAGKLKKVASKYPDVVMTIKAFYKIIEQAQWQSLIDVIFIGIVIACSLQL
jgi:mRNA interferase HigB